MQTLDHFITIILYFLFKWVTFASDEIYKPEILTTFKPHSQNHINTSGQVECQIISFSHDHLSVAKPALCSSLLSFWRYGLFCGTLLETFVPWGFITYCIVGDFLPISANGWARLLMRITSHHYAVYSWPQAGCPVFVWFTTTPTNLSAEVCQFTCCLWTIKSR